MSTPIYDFVTGYAERKESRLHMPGHKGQAFLGFEQFDITEISGADSLYEANGIIKESEQNATAIFGTGRTYFAAGGSSQCIGAMLYLALLAYKKSQVSSTCYERPVVIAARNVHKSFIHAATLLDFDVVWLWPNIQADSICSCPISSSQVEKALEEYKGRVMAVYLTSPDYLGGIQDIATIAATCHKHNTILAVDNAHGAYLHFLEKPLHPMDLGADICVDSAHKTLPVLTGGAYLHINKQADSCFFEQAKYALGLFGSTSPSYLTLLSLDVCNAYLNENYADKLHAIISKLDLCKRTLQKAGWNVKSSDPLKIVVEIPDGFIEELKRNLQENHIVWEYIDTNYVVFMFTPENDDIDLERLMIAFGTNYKPYKDTCMFPGSKLKRVLSIREAMFSNGEIVCVEEAVGRICRVPTIACPPAIPIAVPGERITEEWIDVFLYYGILELDVIKNNGEN